MDNLNEVMRTLIVSDGPGELGNETAVNSISDETLLAILLNRLRKVGVPGFKWGLNLVSVEMEKLEHELKMTSQEPKK